MTTKGRPNNRLRTERRQRGWTQVDVVERMNQAARDNGLPLPSGLDGNYISRYERGVSQPSAHHIHLLCLAFELPTDRLGLPGESETPAPPVTYVDANTAAIRVRSADGQFVTIIVKRRAFFEALGTAAGALLFSVQGDESTVLERSVEPASTIAPEVTLLATALLSDVQAEDNGQPDHWADQAVHFWRLRQAARYRQLANDLPAALMKARSSDVKPTEDRDTARLGALMHLYNAAASLAKSLGSFELAGIAADRAVRTADTIGDPLLRGAAAYRLANVLFSAGQHGTASAIAIGAADRLRPVMTATKSHTAMWGALLATAAQSAARANCPVQAWELLGASKVAADLLTTEHADLFSIFGPASWLIHAVNIAADLGDGADAVRRAESVSTKLLPSFLAERRTFLLLGIVRGHVLCNDTTSATRTLLDAEQTAPEEIRHNPEARRLVFGLLARSSVRNEPLHELAARMSSVTSGETAVRRRQ